VLRRVQPGDIAVFFDQQVDPVANQMAAVPARDRAAHDEHWARILADGSVIARAIVDGDLVVGNIGSWVVHGQRNVGYRIGRQYWGRGLATRALAEFLGEVRDRPLHAGVADHNVASLRVLVKCGFVVVGEELGDDQVNELLLRLDA
jgi:RimJ/RimL family protein N-acetyltransferase